MRIKLSLLAVVAALATSLPVQAGAVLGFGYNTSNPGPGGSQDISTDPNTPTSPPGSQTDRSIPYAFEDFTLGTKVGSTNGGAVGTSAGNPLVLPGNTDVVLQIHMVDSAAYTFTGTNPGASGQAPLFMFQWHVSINNSNTSAVQLQHDPSATDNAMVAMGVNNGNAFPSPQQNLNLDNTNWNSANPTSPTFANEGNIYSAGWGLGGAGAHNYLLGHFVIHTTAAGGAATLSLANPNYPGTAAFSNMGGTDLSATVFATIPQLFISVTPVPEPTSMALAGMAVSGLLYRIRRKKKDVAE